MAERDDVYLDILKGLAVYFDSGFVADIRETVQRFPEPMLGYALNRNQMTSKKWLVETLLGVTGGTLGRICVLGGWYGVLSAMLLDDRRFTVESAVSVDLDPSCAEIAECLNRRHVESGRFRSETADMLALDYDGAGFDMIVNTSCEHVPEIGEWLARVPKGTLLTLQSNDYYGIEGHVNCVDDLSAFRAQVPLAETLFEGEKKLPNYTRFMVIGRK